MNKPLTALLFASAAALPAQINPTASPYGVGCSSCSSSFYELFPSTASFDLSNTAAWSMVPTGGSGCIVVPGFAPFVTPSGAATQVPLANDGEAAVAIPIAFPWCGILTSTLHIAANGVVSLGAGNDVGGNPTVAELLDAPETAWRCWRDYDPSPVGSGKVWHESIGTTVYITWDGVWTNGGSGWADADSFQFQFDANGTVTLVFGGMGSGAGPLLVGYSAGGLSSDHGPTDLSAMTTLSLCCTEVLGMRLDLLGLPAIGTTPQFVTSNIPSGYAFGIVMFGFNRLQPGFDLASFGAPGCQLLVDWFDFEAFLSPGATHTNIWGSFAPVPNYPGYEVFAQSLTFTNSMNVMRTSNGLKMRIG